MQAYTRVVIIDDGVSEDIIQDHIEHFCICANEGIKSAGVPKDSHGTICAQIIRLQNKYTYIIDMKVLERGKGTVDSLILALKWCLKERVKLINISNGFRSFLKLGALNEICYRLYLSGCCIVAACNNDGYIAYPAYSPYVCSVKDKHFMLKHQASKRKDADYYVKSRYWIREQYKFSERCNSYACATLTGRLSREFCSRMEESKYLINDTNGYKTIYDFSMLYDVYTIGLDEQESDELAVGSKLETLNVFLTEIHRVNLIVCDKNIQMTYALLKQYTKSIKCLIWCGTDFPMELRKACYKHRIRYWHEISSGNMKIWDRSMPPIAYFVGDKSMRKCCRKLQEMFLMDGYDAIAFSDSSKAYLFGYRYAADLKKVKYLISRSDPDIALVYSMKFVRSINAILIRECGNGYLLSYRKKTWHVLNMGEIYCRIKSMLGAE